MKGFCCVFGLDRYPSLNQSPSKTPLITEAICHKASIATPKFKSGLNTCQDERKAARQMYAIEGCCVYNACVYLVKKSNPPKSSLVPQTESSHWTPTTLKGNHPELCWLEYRMTWKASLVASRLLRTTNSQIFNLATSYILHTDTMQIVVSLSLEITTSRHAWHRMG